MADAEGFVCIAGVGRILILLFFNLQLILRFLMIPFINCILCYNRNRNRLQLTLTFMEVL